MPTIYDGIGVEQLIDEITFVIADGINDKIAELAPVWSARDNERAIRLNVAAVEHVVETISPENIVTGDIPSLIQDNLPEDHYPNICIIPEQTMPDPEDDSIDQYDVLRNSIDIHSLVKASPEEGANFTYWRAVRTAEALDLLVSSTPKLASKLRGISNPQLVQPSPPFAFQPREGHGDDWWWRAARIRYLVKNYKQPTF